MRGRETEREPVNERNREERSSHARKFFDNSAISFSASFTFCPPPVYTQLTGPAHDEFCIPLLIIAIASYIFMALQNRNKQSVHAAITNALCNINIDASCKNETPNRANGMQSVPGRNRKGESKGDPNDNVSQWGFDLAPTPVLSRVIIRFIGICKRRTINNESFCLDD